jgi:hypothetical protein
VFRFAIFPSIYDRYLIFLLNIFFFKVPVTTKAFMPGKLVNTNEILVLLGENWFAERSSKQACDIIDRRLVNIGKQIEDINREVTIYKDQINWTNKLINVKNRYNSFMHNQKYSVSLIFCDFVE